MHTDELIGVREYLSTSYDPDCDYVDGVVMERNVGEYDHARLLRALIVHFHSHRREWGVHVFPGLRVQVSSTRFRVPDVCVVAGPNPTEQILTQPPFICIEILSPEDLFTAMQEKIRDYLNMGVPYVFIIDPRAREAWRCTPDGHQVVAELRTENPAIAVPVAALFEE